MEDTMPTTPVFIKNSLGLMVTVVMISVCCLGYPVMAANESSNPQDPNQPKSGTQALRGHHLFLTQAMDQVFSVIESIQTDPNLDAQAKQRKIINFLRVARYGPQNLDYFSIIDPQGKMVLDPYNPQYEGKDLTEFTDLNGQQMFKDILVAIDETGEGYVNHQWPRYDQKIAVPKISFVRQHSKIPLIIMTGLYLDTIEAYEQPFTGLTMPFEDDFTNDRKTASPVTQ